MDCEDAGSLISELYDGELVSPKAARHIAHCQSCREKLSDYAALSAEVRLLAAQESEETQMATKTKDALAKRSSFLIAMRKTMRVPRFAAAACVVVIALLAGAWAHTRAQATPLWFQYRFSLEHKNGALGTVGGVVQACGASCERPFVLSDSERLAGMITVAKIEEGKVYLALRLKRFATLPDWTHLSKQMTDVPAVTIVYEPGRLVEIPVTGGGQVGMTGLVVTTKDGVLWSNDFPAQPDPSQVVAVQGVLIQDGQVIAEMPGSGSASGKSGDADAGFYAYVPGHGLFAVGLKPFNGAFPGTVDYGQIRFEENGVKYMLLTGSQITGGTQPRTIWVLHLRDYLPSQHDTQATDHGILFGASGAIDLTLKGMGAIKQE